jgi:hypothetical protein
MLTRVHARSALGTAMLLAALVIIAAAIALGRYAEADDAPGGVVIAAVMIVGAAALGVKGVLHKG